MAQPKHIVFVLRVVPNLSYHRSTLASLLRLGHRVTVVIPSQEPANLSAPVCRELCEAFPELNIQWVKGRTWNRRSAFVVGLREIRSWGSYLRRHGQSPFYSERWKGNLLPWTRRLARWFPMEAFARSRAVDRLLAALDDIFPPDQGAVRKLEELGADLVVASPANLAYSEEVEYLKAAHRRGIPAVVSVLSWDNLSTKGLIHGSPDLVLVWNESHRRQAIDLHHIPETKVRVTGSPFLDKWWERHRESVDRSAFCRKVGLNPGRPFVLYLGSSPSVETDEVRQIKELREAIRSHPDPAVRELQILARPHPSNGAAFQNRQGEDFLIWPAGGELPDTKQSLADFHASVTFSVAAVGLNTTGMMDAAVMDHPCVCWLRESNRKTQADAQHFQELLAAKAVYEASTAEQCLGWVSRLMRGEDTLRENRLALVLHLVRPMGLGVTAGEAAGRALSRLLVAEKPVTVSGGAELAKPAGI